MDVKCRRCNRTLKHPKSILRGIGPTCFERMEKERKIKEQLTLERWFE